MPHTPAPQATPAAPSPHTPSVFGADDVREATNIGATDIREATNADASDTPAQPAPAVIDATQLDALRALQTPDEPNVVQDILDEYRVVSQQLVAALQQALAEGAATRLYETAHSLKSCSANVGACQLSALCGEVELRTREETTPLTPTLASELAPLVAAVLAAHEQATKALADIERGFGGKGA